MQFKAYDVQLFPFPLLYCEKGIKIIKNPSGRVLGSAVYWKGGSLSSQCVSLDFLKHKTCTGTRTAKCLWSERGLFYGDLWQLGPVTRWRYILCTSLQVLDVLSIIISQSHGLCLLLSPVVSRPRGQHASAVPVPTRSEECGHLSAHGLG